MMNIYLFSSLKFFLNDKSITMVNGNQLRNGGTWDSNTFELIRASLLFTKFVLAELSCLMFK